MSSLDLKKFQCNVFLLASKFVIKKEERNKKKKRRRKYMWKSKVLLGKSRSDDGNVEF